MSDIIDQAQERDELFRQTSLSEHFSKSKIATPREARLAMTNRNCEDCGELIPVKRLKANPEAIRCIECQKLYEQKESREE